MGNRLEGKVAIITGGTSGIGAATAELFADEGANVVIAGRSEQKGSALADRLGPNVHYEQQDVTVEDDVRRVIDDTAERFGRLDVLFNNAGGPTAGNVADKMAKLLGNLARANPLKKSGVAWDIATAALFLASEEGRFVNSHDLVVDGGRTSMFNEYPDWVKR